MYSTEGIVIKEENYGEADRFFTIFTKDFGKIRVMAKGIRKIKAKLRSGLQFFNHIYLEFVRGKYFYTAIEAINIDNFQNLKKEPEKLKILFHISNILNKLLKEGRDERIWDLLLKILNKMKEQRFSGARLDLLLRYFEWNLLDILGYHPELHHCVVCFAPLDSKYLMGQEKLKEERLYFSAKEGGILCFRCRDKNKEAKQIDIDTIKILRLILGRKKEILEKLKTGNEKKLKEISRHYLEYILEEKINLL